MSPDLSLVVSVVILFALGITSVGFGFVGKRVRTPNGKRLVGFGLIFLATAIELSIANGLLRSTPLVSGVEIVSFVSGCVIAGIAWYQTRDQ